jgi:hypothetical protein
MKRWTTTTRCVRVVLISLLGAFAPGCCAHRRVAAWWEAAVTSTMALGG